MTAVPHDAVDPTGAARIIDRGYRRYTGNRTGVRGALVTLWRQSVQRALGLRRSVWTKILPFMAVGISYIPAIVFIGIVALVPKSQLTGFTLPTYGEYFPFIAAAIILLVSFIAPQMLCVDRRTGMLGIYLASPLNRDLYLLAKAAAVATVVSMITVGPPLLMLIANIIQGVGPDGPRGVALTLVRIVASGLILAVLYTSVSMGIASLTDRWVFATAAILIVLLVSQAFFGTLVEAAGLPDAIHAFNLIIGPFALVAHMHGEYVDAPGLTLAVSLIGVGAWTLLGVIVCRTRYQMLQVTR